MIDPLLVVGAVFFAIIIVGCLLVGVNDLLEARQRRAPRRAPSDAAWLHGRERAFGPVGIGRKAEPKGNSAGSVSASTRARMAAGTRASELKIGKHKPGELKPGKGRQLGADWF